MGLQSYLGDDPEQSIAVWVQEAAGGDEPQAGRLAAGSDFPSSAHTVALNDGSTCPDGSTVLTLDYALVNLSRSSLIDAGQLLLVQAYDPFIKYEGEWQPFTDGKRGFIGL
ncbi:hypothetical protein BDV98DRAFT_392234 [Pterulicium gracile]|uniref:Uncharacterized protein n=1 Tax=Pterulicium gracile TaxID=1884261 RepID=A0A5C3QPW0_9AGAR|nr:hypothetical protein BDV98DRAFT_392234 [Pterula gracilis]